MIKINERLDNALKWCKEQSLRPKPLHQWKADNKEHIKKYTKGWRKKNPEKYRAVMQRGKTKRRAKKREIINTLTSEEWITILEKHNYRCAYCGVEFDENTPPTKNHIIPISRGGHNIKENIVPACRSCNSSKKNKKPYVN